MDIRSAIKANPLFRDLDRRALRALIARAEWVELRGGQFLFHAGEPSEALYLVASGRIRVVRPLAGGGRILAEIGHGETVGEISVVTSEQHTADALAMRDSSLVRISKQVFEQLVSRYPNAMLRVTRLIVERLRAAEQPPERESVRSTRTYAVVPAHPGVDVTAFARALALNLRAAAATLRLDPERVDRALGAQSATVDFGDGEPSSRLAGWLTQLEDGYRYLVYQGNDAPDAWTRRCLRQADRVIVVAHADQRPFVSRNLAWLVAQGLHAPVELVLVQRGPKSSHSALAWRAVAGAMSHYHMGADLPATDMAHLARMVSGRGVCLVLGGGGARGFAHVGLIRAMREKGIPIDAVGGTSMGAMVAAMVALGLDVPQMLSNLRETFVTGKFLNDYSLSRISLISAEKFRKRLLKLFGDQRIEDLAIPFYCVSTNLTRGVPVVHDSGELATWVGASMAVPGIAPPIVHRGDLLVDGGLLNAIPFDTMAALGRGSIIVSDVSREPNLRVTLADDVETTSLLSVGPAARHLNMFKILFHTATLTSERESHEVAARADLMLHMPVGGVSMFDWDELDEIVYRAYHHADQQLDEWLVKRPDEARVLPRDESKMLPAAAS